MNAKKKVLMSSTTTSIRQIPGRQEQLSTRIVFFIAGFGMAAWAPLVPFAKIRANIDDGLLGLLLLCLGVGSIVAMPLAGALAARLGCRRRGDRPGSPAATRRLRTSKARLSACYSRFSPSRVVAGEQSRRSRSRKGEVMVGMVNERLTSCRAADPRR